MNLSGNGKMDTLSGDLTEINMTMNVLSLDAGEESRTLQHRGEVNLESGNIRFDGDVQIEGNVHPSMYVGASGVIRIEGTVTKATIHAVESIFIQGNTFSSTINVGDQNVIIGELCRMLKEIMVFLQQAKENILQVPVHIENGKAMEIPILTPIAPLTVAENYPNFRERIKEYSQKVKNHTDILKEEWSVMADHLYNIFIIPLNEQLQDVQTFELLLNEAERIMDKYTIDISPKSELVIPYAINSVLCSSGDIHVTSKGIFHCMVTAQQDINVIGVCRGGEIVANRKISIQEAGSENGVKTVIRTSAEGSVTIGLVHAGTEITVGPQSHTFHDKKLGVYARLDERGELMV